MAKLDSESFRTFEALVAQTGGTYSFDGETSVTGSRLLFEMVGEMGLDPMKTADLREGLRTLFNIEVYNMPDLTNGRFILAPNHVSDFDAIILGLLHPRIRIVAKNDWTDNEKLKDFLSAHYDLYGLDRASLQSLRGLLKDAVGYFKVGGDSRHYLVFSQGTISDFNNNSPERVSSVAEKISDKTGVPIVCMFIEQVSLYEPTRIIFDSPMTLSKKDDFREVWLRREAALQSALQPAARRPKLSYKHANNNKPGDLFFAPITKET
ncbi:MAG: 1-acyl-sn-glycerol-3-phosphate acyltransferase [Oscillospiraceae bacterium]|jgi:hypothetical protein|nr:1-acyl-sn-glycerol-3-phosphate acyltransferase [Oscillospiraceae bacterium]